ncbi:hypothetical protein Sjap_004219 [Stephania japonica]|uniref:Bulb-type lectin domain-containing protein n=1 Tax=Stephania japonica TaxID=461633 RepID=A0AAP0K1X5_9MAGN
MLFDGKSLNTIEFLENESYRLEMQGDCNLVLYVNQNRALWSWRTDGRGTSCRATLQNDGNLVVVSKTEVVWSSDSVKGPNTYRLIVQTELLSMFCVNVNILLAIKILGSALQKVVVALYYELIRPVLEVMISAKALPRGDYVFCSSNTDGDRKDQCKDGEHQNGEKCSLSAQVFFEPSPPTDFNSIKFGL